MSHFLNEARIFGLYDQVALHATGYQCAFVGVLGEGNRNECGKECQVLETCRIDGVKGCFKNTKIEGFTISEEKPVSFPKSEYAWGKEKETPE